MSQALAFGLIASAPLVVGAALAGVWRPPGRVTGYVLAFAGGALIAAISVELFADAFEKGGPWRSGLGLLAGAVVFVVLDGFIDRRAEPGASPLHEAIGRAGAPGLLLLAGVVLDGVPENLALGVSLGEGTSIALLVAIFVSNLPEAFAGGVAMRDRGRTRRYVLATWGAAAVLLTGAVLLGRLLADLDEALLSVLLGFAGGAVLATLADTVMPEAFKTGGAWTALATAAGFFVSFVLDAV